MGQRTTALISLVLAAVLVGCAPPSAPEPSASPPSVAVQTPTPTGSPSTEVLVLGEPAVTPRGSTMTVHAFGPGARTAPAPDGTGWKTADIEFCLAPTVRSTVPTSTIRVEFRVETQNGALIRPDDGFVATDEVFHDPARTVVADECLRGAVVFAVPEDDPAEHVGLFSPLGELRWSVD